MATEQAENGGGSGELELVEVTSQWGLVSFGFTVHASGTRVTVDTVGGFLGLEPSRTYASDSADAPDTWVYSCEGRTSDESASVFGTLIADLTAREAKLTELKQAGVTLSLDVFGYGHTGSAFTINSADLASIARLGIQLTIAVSDSAR